MTDAEHEYVEFQIEVKAGKIVSCEEVGRGYQRDPITEPIVSFPAENVPWPPEAERLARKIKRAFGAIT